jgi:hypothetical protein
MASVAEQMASNISLANFAKATELQKRLWFTLGALILFRLLSYVPMPGIDPAAMTSLFNTQKGGVLDFFNTFSGGSLSRMSIIALGVMPYITRPSSFSSARPSMAVAGPEERRRDRAKEAQPVHPLPDRAADQRAGLFHCRRS